MRSIIKDRSGKISGVMAALLAMILILIYTRVASTPKGSEDAFFTVYGALKWFLKALDLLKYIEEYLKGFEEFLKYVQGTILWPITISILSLVVTIFAIIAIYYGTVITVGTTARVLGWVSGVRARREANWKSVAKPDIGKAAAHGKIVRPKKLKRKKKDAVSEVNSKEKSSATSKQQDLTGWFRTQWWQVSETFTLVLEKGKLREYVLEALKLYPTNRSQDGSYIELAKATGIDAKNFHRIVNEGRDSITVGNLIKILRILNLPYESVTPHIKSIGGRGDQEAIVNPKFPIDMYCPEGARLLAAALKDGDINVKHHHFEYINYDPDNLRIVAECVKKVFGEIEPSILYEENGKRKGIHFQSALIGNVLKDAGAVIGRKADRDYHLPSMIWFGNREIKNAYFDQVIKDEGSIDRGDYRLTISGAGEIASKITQAHRRLLDQFHYDNNYWPSGAPKKYITLKKGLEDDLPDDLRPTYKDFIKKMKDEWVPTILQEEKKLLEEMYNVEVEIQPRQIYIGKKVGLRGSWELIIGGKYEVIRIKDELNSFRKKWGEEKK